jgi:two-component system cell cycle response regulator
VPQPTRDEPTPLVSRVSVVRIASVSDAQGVAHAPARVAKALTAVGGLLFAVLAVGLAVSGGQLPASNAGIDGAYVGVLFASVGLCALRAACWRRERVAWGLLSGALAAETLGMVYYSVVLVRVKHPAIPSPADIGYLAFYPLAFAGLIGVLRSRQPRVPAALWADGVIAALAATALSATVVFNTVLAGAHGNTGAVITELTYPLCDLLLIGLLVTALAASAATLDRTGVLLAAGLLVFTFTDSVFLVQTVRGTFVPGGPLDLGWPLALLLIGMAAWQPPRTMPARKESRASISVAVGSAMVALGILVVDHFAPVNPLVLALATMCILAVCARLAIAFAETQRALSAACVQALTDPVTGLGNRHQLTADLVKRLGERDVCPGVLVLADLDGFKAYNDTFGHPAGDMLLHRLGVALSRWAQGRGTAYRMGGDEFCVLVNLDDASARNVLDATAGIRRALSEAGSSFTVDCSCGTVELSELRSGSPSEALRMADRRMYATKNSKRTSAFTQTRDVLLAVSAERDGDLHSHLHNVAGRAQRIAEELGLDPEEVVRIGHAAQLHDIGKLAIPEAILHKPGSLTEQEWRFMRQHTIIGERIAAACIALAPVAALIRSSHERYDGGGYPDGLTGEDIPMGARVVFVCGAFDAMTSERTYSAARSPADAIAELRRCAGSQFDPRVVEAFIATSDCAPANTYQSDSAPAAARS